MHSIKVSVRLIALLAVAIVAVLAFASLSPGTPEKASAVNTVEGPFTIVFASDPIKADRVVVDFVKKTAPETHVAAQIKNPVLIQNAVGNPCPAPVITVVKAGTAVQFDWGTKCVAKLDSVVFTVESDNKEEVFITDVRWFNGPSQFLEDNLTGVTCTDIYLDRPPTTTKGNPPGPEDDLVAKSLTRTERSQDPNKAGGYDITSVTYLGPDLKPNDESAIGDLVPDKPPTLLPCDEKRTNGKDGPEKNQMNPNTPFNPISNHRVSATSNWVKQGGQVTLQYSTCVFSEVNKQWVRTDIVTVIKETDKQGINFGYAVLNLGTAPPATGLDVDGDGKMDVAVDQADALTCVNITGTIPFPNILVSHARNATTDHPEQAKNTFIAIDPDGAVVDACAAHVIVTNEKEKDEAECQDGSVGGEAPNFVADDWDGDGCPDWDELDKDFINGRDPFNPNDCGLNFTGAYTALATVQAATDGTAGSYFHAIVALVHQKEDGEVKTKYTLVDPILIGATSPVIVDVSVDPKGTPNKNFVDGDFIKFQGQDEWFRVNAVQKGEPLPASVHRLTLKREQKSTTAEAHAAGKTVILQVAANEITGALQVYIDSPLLSGAGPNTSVPSGSDGNPGAPPPPPFTVSAPSELNGVFDKVNQRLIIELCIGNIGGLFAPNAIAIIDIDAHSLKGTVDIHGNQTQAACEAKEFNNTVGLQGQPIKILGAAVQLARQGINSNVDKDKCTDMEELLGTGPATCGDDPYNPNDSDENFSAVGNLLVTVVDAFGAGGADWDKTEGIIIPGIYYHCITDTQHDKDTNELQVKAFCYIDSTTPGICQINVEAYPGVCGDGIAGAGPPWPATKKALPYQEAWADVDDNQTKLTGTYDPVTHEINIAGCFSDKDGFGAQGNVYTTATFNAGTGQGTAQLRILIDSLTDCEDGPPFATGIDFPTSKLETVEQAAKVGNGSGYDTDRDGCSDKEELGDNQVLGGLRDPYKYWDFFDPTQNRAIGFTDFLALVQRSGAVDFNNDPNIINRHTDPLSLAPAPPAYHPRFDRGGAQFGANGWNEKPPNGSIGFGDFLSLVRQSGHTCLSGPNDPKYPYLS